MESSTRGALEGKIFQGAIFKVALNLPNAFVDLLELLIPTLKPEATISV